MRLRALAQRGLRLVPSIDALYRMRERLFVPPGHFYSPVPSLEEVRERQSVIFADPAPVLDAIDLNVQGQLAELATLAPVIREQPFTSTPENGRRYFYGNTTFDYADGLFLHGIIRRAAPRRIVEVGSGASSCMILDTNEVYFDNAIACTFIEPFPENLLRAIKPGDLDRVKLIRERLQDVHLDEICSLAPGDILVIDSTHVAKTGSDVNRLFFEVLPRLAAGVLVHVHDVFYPFEYRRDWILEGRAWNELYMLRAFLEYNRSFRIRLFVDYLVQFHSQELRRVLPPAWRDVERWTIGSSFWMEKVDD